MWRGRVADIPVAPPFVHALAGVEEREGGVGGASAAGDRGAFAGVARRAGPPRQGR